MFNPYPSSRELSRMNAERIEELENENAQLRADNETKDKQIEFLLEGHDGLAEISANALNAISRYQTAQAEGRILPCKAGDKIYRINAGEIEEAVCDGFDVNNAGVVKVQFYSDYTQVYTSVYSHNLGKTWWLTRAAAAAALEAEKGNCNDNT